MAEREFCELRKKQEIARQQELEVQAIDKRRREHQQRYDHFQQLRDLHRRRDFCEDLLIDEMQVGADPRSIAFAKFMREKKSGLWGGPDGMDDIVRVREDTTVASRVEPPRRAPPVETTESVNKKTGKVDEDVIRLFNEPTAEVKEVIRIMTEESKRLTRLEEVEFTMRGTDSGYCHGCKHTGAETIHFCPRCYKAHGLCPVHFDKEFRLTQAAAMALSKTKDPKHLPLCAVCSLSCNCRSCLRMKTRRAVELMRKYAIAEGGDPGDMEMPPPEVVRTEVRPMTSHYYQ